MWPKNILLLQIEVLKLDVLYVPGAPLFGQNTKVLLMIFMYFSSHHSASLAFAMIVHRLANISAN